MILLVLSREKSNPRIIPPYNVFPYSLLTPVSNIECDLGFDVRYQTLNPRSKNTSLEFRVSALHHRRSRSVAMQAQNLNPTHPRQT